MEQHTKPIEKTKREKIILKVIDIVFVLVALLFVYKISKETGPYTSIVTAILIGRLWFKKEVMKISYFMMRKITNTK